MNAYYNLKTPQGIWEYLDLDFLTEQYSKQVISYGVLYDHLEFYYNSIF